MSNTSSYEKLESNKNGNFHEMAAFKRCGVKTSEKATIMYAWHWLTSNMLSPFRMCIQSIVALNA